MAAIKDCQKKKAKSAQEYDKKYLFEIFPSMISLLVDIDITIRA